MVMLRVTIGSVFRNAVPILDDRSPFLPFLPSLSAHLLVPDIFISATITILSMTVPRRISTANRTMITVTIDPAIHDTTMPRIDFQIITMLTTAMTTITSAEFVSMTAAARYMPALLTTHLVTSLLMTIVPLQVPRIHPPSPSMFRFG